MTEARAQAAGFEVGSLKQIIRELQKRGMPIKAVHEITVASLGELHGKFKLPRKKGSFFPYRNLILASIGAFYGYHKDIFELGLGLVTDTYPDCTPDFQRDLERVLSTSVDEKIHVRTPFISQRKSDILKYGGKHDFPYHLTYSCYQAGRSHCGQCDGCMGRQRAFKEAQIKDPTEYEEPMVL